MGRKLFSLFPGLGYAAGYKVSQRIYKFGGQPWFNDVLTRNYKTSYTNAFGERKGRMMMQATAGSLTGIGEVVLLPLDALKIKRQVNPDAFRGRGVIRIFREEGTTLYRGWGWTVARNAPGSFAVRCLPPLSALLSHADLRAGSFLAPAQSRRIMCSASQTIARQHGRRTLSLP